MTFLVLLCCLNENRIDSAWSTPGRCLTVNKKASQRDAKSNLLTNREEIWVGKLNSRAERMRYREVSQIRENGCRSLSLKVWRRGSEKGMSKGKDDRRVVLVDKREERKDEPTWREAGLAGRRQKGGAALWLISPRYAWGIDCLSTYLRHKRWTLEYREIHWNLLDYSLSTTLLCFVFFFLKKMDVGLQIQS